MPTFGALVETDFSSIVALSIVYSLGASFALLTKSLTVVPSGPLILSAAASTVIPFVDFVINYGENTDYLVCTIMGAILTGAGCGLALRYGSSTGGIDILGQVFSIEKGISIGMFTMMFNVLIAVFGGGILFKDWQISMFTLIRIIISSLVIDRIHTAYNYVRLDIISNNVKEIAERLMKELGRGVTLMNVEGAYTHQQKQDAFMIITSYELARAKRICLEVDPTVFIVIAPAKGTVGRFIKKTIM